MERKKVSLGIVVVIALVLGSRGLFSIVTMHYESTAKYFGPYMLDGNPAIAIGIAYLAMGLAFLAFVIWILWPQQKVLAWAWGLTWCAISIAGSILSFTLR